MKKILILLAMVIMLSGCGTKTFLGEIPGHEFKRFEYHRAGNATSTHIIATDAVRDDGYLLIDSIHITADYGPFANFVIKLEGYGQELKKEE